MSASGGKADSDANGPVDLAAAYEARTAKYV